MTTIKQNVDLILGSIAIYQSSKPSRHRRSAVDSELSLREGNLEPDLAPQLGGEARPRHCRAARVTR